MQEEDSAEFIQVQNALQAQGLHAALRILNSRTPFRFTGVYRFDGEVLRNVALFDRWAPEKRQGEDAPIAQTFCGIVGSVDQAVEVVDGRTDQRFPWMQGNPVVSYCGTPIRDAEGQVVGTLCHFDLKPVQSISSELPLLARAAELFEAHLAAA